MSTCASCSAFAIEVGQNLVCMSSETFFLSDAQMKSHDGAFLFINLACIFSFGLERNEGKSRSCKIYSSVIEILSSFILT